MFAVLSVKAELRAEGVGATFAPPFGELPTTWYVVGNFACGGVGNGGVVYHFPNEVGVFGVVGGIVEGSIFRLEVEGKSELG